MLETFLCTQTDNTQYTFLLDTDLGMEMLCILALIGIANGSACAVMKWQILEIVQEID